MSPIFKLQITKEASTLSLLKEGEVVDTRSWPEDRDMGRRLFESIKELLEKNNLKARDIADFVLESEIPDMFTSMRIAETVKKVYTFGVQSKTNKKG